MALVMMSSYVFVWRKLKRKEEVKTDDRGTVVEKSESYSERLREQQRGWKGRREQAIEGGNVGKTRKDSSVRRRRPTASGIISSISIHASV